MRHRLQSSDPNGFGTSDAMLLEASGQIEKKRYDVEMRSRGIDEIIKIGIAFAGKKVKLMQV